MKRLNSIVIAAVAVPFFLVGCTASANLTDSADSVATQAADALQEQVGTDEAPDVDCGEDRVDLVDDTVVDCILIDPVSGAEYDTSVTISDVDGTDFRISVSVASEPN